MREDITGFPFSVLPLDDAIAQLVEWVRGDPPPRPAPVVAFVNPHSVEAARRDPAFAAAIRATDFVAPDGGGIVLASRILGGRIRERVCGPDVFVALSRRLSDERKGTRVFFLGAREETLAAVADRYRREFPGLVVAGTLAPPFKPEFSPADDAAMIEAVNAAHADLLWVGLGAPKQEKWAHRVRDRLAVNLIAPVGAVFDFYAGRTKLPPQWTHRWGGITIYRLFQEPRRVWRRNLDNPVFLARVFAQAWNRRVRHRPA